MAAAVGQLGEDLLAETHDLVGLVASLSLDQWETPTPAPGWSIGDQIGHLAFFDEQVTLAATDPDAFARQRLEAVADVDRFVEDATHAARQRPVADLVPWLYEARHTMIEAAGAADPQQRIPWFGPDMNIASALTARIMETWAHGQDVADALGRTRTPTERLRHICFLGYRSFPNSYRSRGLEVPEAPVGVVLEGTDGVPWTFGAPDAADQVRGSALDFCLVVTQRRHRDDTDLVCEGAVATQWLGIAQAFAGPPGSGRRPGQFTS
jgi:uncharacterized protein (TIGR03084 family)